MTDEQFYFHVIGYIVTFFIVLRIGFLWGYDRKCREITAKEVEDSLEVVDVKEN